MELWRRWGNDGCSAAMVVVVLEWRAVLPSGHTAATITGLTSIIQVVLFPSLVKVGKLVK
jgi:hypothetical protein